VEKGRRKITSMHRTQGIYDIDVQIYMLYRACVNRAVRYEHAKDAVRQDIKKANKKKKKKKKDRTKT
jgi:hypothetical protein